MEISDRLNADGLFWGVVWQRWVKVIDSFWAIPLWLKKVT